MLENIHVELMAWKVGLLYSFENFVVQMVLLCWLYRTELKTTAKVLSTACNNCLILLLHQVVEEAIVHEIFLVILRVFKNRLLDLILRLFFILFL